MRLILHLLGVEVLDWQLDFLSRYEDSEAASTDDDTDEFQHSGDGTPLVQEGGRPADALTGFYQPPYYEEEDRHAGPHPRRR